jgi:kynurenine formamidase
MKIRTLVTGYVLALALLLFAQQRHSEAAQATAPGIRAVVDLTHTLDASTPTFEADSKSTFRTRTVATIEKDHYFARDISLPEHFGTHLDAPAHFVSGLWTVDQIPADRLVAPMSVIDVSAKVKANPDYQFSVEDIAAWEHDHGHIPQGAVVMLRTGWDARWTSSKAYRNADAKGVMHFPGYSLDAAKFLVEGRQVMGLGIDTLSIDYGPSQNFPVHQYVLSHSAYQLENVANLGHVPVQGAIVVVAPMKLAGGSGSPVRLLALVK